MRNLKLTNWGKYPVANVNLETFSTPNELKEFISHNSDLIARGLGRCYGDSSLAKNTISMTNFNRLLSFNENTSELTCEAGTSIEKILNVFIPKGYFMPVVPGTKFVTIGGAIASDIHGKNHHLDGSISRHLTSIKLMLADGSTVECSPHKNAELFWATCGGIGLTGIILEATIKLKKIETAYINQEKFKCRTLDEAMEAFKNFSDSTYTVAWLDCMAKGKDLGRSIFIRGEHTKTSDLPNNIAPLSLQKKIKLDIPLELPSFVLNHSVIKIFNSAFYHKVPNGRTRNIVSYDSFFFPLDSIHRWNNIYGKRGFFQYQFVLPEESSYKGLREILLRVSESNHQSFLTVLKLFGEQEGLLSFPRKGYTLAMDFPISEKLFAFLDNLDEIVVNCRGRIYLTKDARMRKEVFYKCYDNLKKFLEIKYKFDNHEKFKSLQAERIIK